MRDKSEDTGKIFTNENNGQEIAVNDYVEYLQTMSIGTIFNWHILSKFKTVKKIRFCGLTFPNAQMLLIDKMKPVLDQVEEVSVHQCFFPNGHGIFENILQYCPKLKRLHISRNHWRDCLPQKYPMLEFLNLKYEGQLFIDRLITFFELNPQVQNLQIYLDKISSIGHMLCDAKIKLDNLAIYGDFKEEESIELINNLFDRGLYNRLHINGTKPIETELLVKLKNLVSLYSDLDVQIAPPMKSIQEIGLHTITESNFNENTNLCANLKRLIIHRATVDEISPFIRNLPQLIEIAVHTIKNGNAIDLRALNNDREKLKSALLVVLYVDEDTYLKTKWAFNNDNIGLSLIEMRRWSQRNRSKDVHDFRF